MCMHAYYFWHGRCINNGIDGARYWWHVMMYCFSFRVKIRETLTLYHMCIQIVVFLWSWQWEIFWGRWEATSSAHDQRRHIRKSWIHSCCQTLSQSRVQICRCTWLGHSRSHCWGVAQCCMMASHWKKQYFYMIHI